MQHLGDYDASTSIHGHFTTFRPSTGASFTLGGTPALSVYKDGSTTQSTAGITLTPDFDGVTGLNYFNINTASDGSFYSVGSNFSVVITAGTVDGVSVVGAVVASFSIRKNSALKPSTAGRTFNINASNYGEVDTVLAAGTPWGSGAITAFTIADGAITANKINNGAITANKFAAEAITASTLAADVGTEIGTAVWATTTRELTGTGTLAGDVADAVWDESRALHSTPGTFGEGVTSVQELGMQAKLDVNAEVLDVLDSDTFAEPGQGAPGATISLAQKISYLYKAWRNRSTQTASQYSLYNDAASTVDQKATFSDNGTTADRGEISSGP